LDYWLRFSFADESMRHQIKLARVGAGHSDSYVYPHFFTSHWISGNGTYTETRNCTAASTDADTDYDYDTPPANTWTHIQIAMDIGNTDTPNGMYDVWQDGVYKGGDSNLDWTREGCNPMQQIWIGGYLGNADRSHETVIFYDDVYFDNTWARIEIGDSPNYNSCTHRETQLPTVWDDGELSFTLNAGSFSNGEQSYIFVVDELGNVSETGYPLVIVQTLSGPGTPGVPVIKENK